MLCATIAVQVKFLVKLWKLVNAIRSGVNFRSVGHLEESQAPKGSFLGGEIRDNLVARPIPLKVSSPKWDS